MNGQGRSGAVKDGHERSKAVKDGHERSGAVRNGQTIETMHKTVVINIVGLTSRLIGEHTPFIRQWSQARGVTPIEPVLPAVTCSAQATYLTGVLPAEHGIVGNGWYFR